MGDGDRASTADAGAGPVTLSTGESVALPLSTEATMYGAAFGASRDAVATLLPDGLSPLRVTPRRAAVGLLSVEYHRIGDDVVAPYDEFAVVVPVVEGAPGLPIASALARPVGGYVQYMPVTTESGRALGVDVWGYPKVVGEIDFEDTGSGRRTTVHVDGEHVVTFAADRPPTADRGASTASYSTIDGRLLRERLDLDGELGAWPYSTRTSRTLGDHPSARELRSLDLGRRALVRWYADGEFVVHPGEHIGTR